jgi:hypothetical protein
MDWSTILKYGTDKTMAMELVKVGVVGGLVYRCLNWYIESRSNRIGLPPGVESVYDDVELTKLLMDIQNYRGVSENEFLKTVENADRLVHRYINLRDRNILPELRDRVDAYTFFRSSVTGAYSMCEATKIKHAGKDAAVLYRLYQKLYYRLQQYFRSIISLTAYV